VPPQYGTDWPCPAALVDENLLGFPCAPSSIRHRPMLAAWPQPSGATRRAGRSPPPRSERPGGPSLFHTRARRVKRSCWRRAVRAHRARAPNDASRQRKRTRTVRSRPTATAVGARFGAPPPPAASIPPTPRRGARTAGRHRIRGIGTGSDGRAAPYIHALKLFGPPPLYILHPPSSPGRRLAVLLRAYHSATAYTTE
jgi:hypothetical protein